jgi:predicted nucleic acid-binding protein
VKILFDTNVVLDVLLDRAPHSDVAIELFGAVENSIIQGYLCATTITTVDYLATKAIGKTEAKIAINALLELFLIAEVNQQILKAANISEFADFEDAVLYQAGCHAGVDGVVTRNGKDFMSAERPVYSPDELLSIIRK